MLSRLLLNCVFVVSLFGCVSHAQDTVTDADGNVYQTAQIGEQVWMLENFKSTKLNDGEPIQKFDMFSGDDLWFFEGVNIPLFVWADTSDLNKFYDFDLPIDFYGALYSFAAVSSGRLAPEGWRVASADDFIQLEQFIANAGNPGQTAQALRGVVDWLFLDPGTDQYGFRALPAGFTTAVGNPDFAQVIAMWTTSDFEIVDGDVRTTTVTIFQEPTLIFDNNADPRFGGSVRCVKDATDLLLGDVNGDGVVDLLDVAPFIELLENGGFLKAADVNQDGVVNLLDVDPFVVLIVG